METTTFNPYEYVPDRATLLPRLGGIAVRAFEPTADADKTPRSWAEQTEVLAAQQCLSLLALSSTVETAAVASVYRGDLETKLAARTEAVTGYLGDILADSPFADSVVVTLTRSKSVESIAAKTERKPDAMYDLHAMQLVTRDEDSMAARAVLEYLRDAVGTPEYDVDGKPTVTQLGNPHSGDGFSGQQAKLLTVIDDEVVPVEVQAYTPAEYVRYWETRPVFESNRGYGVFGGEVLDDHQVLAFQQLETAGILMDADPAIA